jgi:hypothetical protein
VIKKQNASRNISRITKKISALKNWLLEVVILMQPEDLQNL